MAPKPDRKGVEPAQAERLQVIDSMPEPRAEGRSRSPRCALPNAAAPATSMLGIDRNAPIREDIRNGTAADYKLIVAQIHGCDLMQAILQQLHKRRSEWRPIAAAFSDVGRARDFAVEMCRLRLPTEVVTLDTPSRERERIAESLDRGDLEAVACVECSIDAAAIETVAICDEQTSPSCVYEMIRYASKMHNCKPYFRVVYMCKEPDHVATSLRMIVDGDPCIRATARALFLNKGRADSRINISHENDSEEIGETFLKRLGEIMTARAPRKPRVRRERRARTG